MKQKAEIRIYIASPIPIVRAGLFAILSQTRGFKIVGVCDSENTRCSEVETLDPDILLIDTDELPDRTVELLKQCRERLPGLRCVLLAPDDEETVFALFEAGAHSAILKSSAVAELIRGIRETAAGNMYFSPEVSRLLMRRFPRKEAGGRKDSGLSGREVEILKLIAQGHSNEQAALALGLSPLTIKTHRSRIMKKLNLHTTADLVRFAARKKIVEF